MFLLSLSEWLAADFSIIATHSSRDREPSGLLRLTGILLERGDDLLNQGLALVLGCCE